MKEVWRDIKGYEGLYRVSNKGRIKRLGGTFNYVNKNQYSNVKTTFHKKEKILKNILYQNGYYGVSLCKENKCKNNLIHRLIAIHFISNKKNKKQVNHIDGIKTNNNIDNLEWVTPKENVRHAIDIGLKKPNVYSNETLLKMRNTALDQRGVYKKRILKSDYIGHKHRAKKTSIRKDGVRYDFNSRIDACEFMNVSPKTLIRYEKRNKKYIFGYEIIKE